MKIVDTLRQNSTLSDGKVIDLLENPAGVGGGDVTYNVQAILYGNTQKITPIIGVVQKISLLDGILSKRTTFTGELQKIEPIEGVITKNNNIIGTIKCQK